MDELITVLGETSEDSRGEILMLDEELVLDEELTLSLSIWRRRRTEFLCTPLGWNPAKSICSFPLPGTKPKESKERVALKENNNKKHSNILIHARTIV